MAKTMQEYKDKMAQLLIQAGEKQFYIRNSKKVLDTMHNELNTLYQKIENTQKEIATFLKANPEDAKKLQAEMAAQPVETPDANTPT